MTWRNRLTRDPTETRGWVWKKIGEDKNLSVLIKKNRVSLVTRLIRSKILKQPVDYLIFFNKNNVILFYKQKIRGQPEMTRWLG